MPAPAAPGPFGIEVRWTPVTDRATRRDVAWDLLRTLLPDPAARITNECPQCGGPHGPVRIGDADVRLSVAYAAGFAIVCVATGAASVGIDAEPEHDERRDAAGMTGIVRPDVRASVREWTRIEAVLKADGRGLRVDPAAVTITGTDDGVWLGAIDDSPRRFTGRDLPGPSGVIVSAALEPLGAAEGPGAGGGRATR